MIILFMILYSLLSSAGFFGNNSADVTTPAPLHKHKNITNLRHHKSHILHPKFRQRHHNSGRRFIYNVTGGKLGQHQQKKHHRSHRNKRIPDIPIQSNYVTKYIEVCPESGYFFKHDVGSDLPGSCHLCFCKDNSSATCWPRDNKHCDNEHYEHLTVVKKEQRSRRSPLSFSDIFMRDATKTAIAGIRPQQCQPHEASRSEGCPPDDWCVGCTVCDCSVNGMWDCHLLSFCTEDDKKRKKAKKLLASVRRPDDPYGSQKPKLSSALRKQAKEAVQKLAEKMALARQKKKTGKAMAQRRHFFFSNGTLKNNTLFDTRKRIKSKYLQEFDPSEVGKVLAVNLKVRKMSDNITKKRIEEEQENGRKVAQVLNFQVRGMKDNKTRRNIKRRHSDAVNVLAKRQPVRKKKNKLSVPPGFKLPSDMKNNFVLETQQSDPATKGLPDNVLGKQRNKNHALNRRPVRRAFNNQNNPEKGQVKQHIEKKMSTIKVPGGTMPNMMKRSNEVKRGTRQVIRPTRQTPRTTTPKPNSQTIKKLHRRFINPKGNSKTGNGVKEKRHILKSNMVNENSKANTKINNNNLKNANSKNNHISNTKNNPKDKSEVRLKKSNSKTVALSNKPKNISKNKLLKDATTKKSTKSNSKDTSSNDKSTKSPKAVSKPAANKAKMKTNHPKIKVDEKKLNENLMQMRKQIQTQLNSKLLKAVGEMLGQTLTEAPVKKVKRAAILDNIYTNNNKTTDYYKPTGIDIPMVKISVENTENSTDPPETRVPRQIDFSKLQKQMHTNLNRRLIQEVEKMIDSPLTEPSVKRQKRFAQLMKKVVKKSVDGKHNETKPLSIPFIKKKHALSASKHVSRRHIALSNLQGYIHNINRKSNQKQLIPSVGIRTKRFALDNNNTNTESQIPVLIKQTVEINVETTTPAPTQVGKRQDPARLRRQNIPDSRRNSLQDAAKELLILPTNQVKFNTAKRSASLYKKVVVKKIVSENRNKSKLIEIPIKKSQKINVDKSNKIKIRRYKRNSNEEQYDHASLEDIEKSNTVDSFEATSKPMQNLVSTTESSVNYYKYSVDEFDKTVLPKGDYMTEIKEVYSKNVAAKRSVDNQITGLPDLTVLKLAINNGVKTSTVRSLEDVNNYSNTTELNLNKVMAGNNNISVVQNVESEIVEMKTHRTKKVLDNQVVIIQEQNMSSVENMTEAFDNSYSSDFVSHPVTSNTVEIKDLINRTVVSIDEQKHNKIENVTEIEDKSVKKRITEHKFSSDNLIDRTVVIINDQNTAQAMTEANKQPLMGPTTETISKLKFVDSILTTINTSEEPSSVSLPKNIIIQSYENVGKNIAILTEKSVELNQTTENYKTTENELIIKNKFTTVGKLPTEYKLKRKTDLNPQNVTKNATLVIPLNIPNKVTLLPTVKNYLKYKVDKKAFTKKQDLLKRIKQKQAKRKKLQKQEYMLQTTTERTDQTSKTKHKIDDHIVFVLQKDIETKVRKNISAVYNDSFSNVIDTNEIKPNIWNDETTLAVVEQNFTTALYQNIYKSTEQPPVFEYKVKKNVSRLTLPKKKVSTYDITKVSLSKKRKLKKVVVTLHNKTKKSEILHSNNIIITQPEHKNGTNDLKSFFKKLLEGFNIKKGNRKGKQARKFKILKYLQKFFKKIFVGGSKHKKNSTDDPHLNKRNIIETLCATFGPCNINVKNKLQSQINHLNIETYKMLRSVKIIKGLLKLVDFAKNDKQIDAVSKTTTKTKFKNDVQKLHAILKNTYLDEEQLEKLTDTQKIQIAYIKNNTQDFIQSAGKFTMVLNEIINIITVPDKSTEVNHKTFIANQQKIGNKRQSKIKDSKRNPKEIPVKNKTDTNQPLQKLRELLTRYNMIQNTFMRKIYRALTNIDTYNKENINKINNTEKAQKESGIINSNVHNKTEAIQVYTKNIIQNLRKLKNLAQTLNGGNVRRKRDLRDDDSIEYLLMLMEYLLKQNHPLDAAPVNDGIDLLIEAIKNAPDIKPIKKKVLQFHAQNFTTTSTIDSSEAISSKEDSASDVDVKVSKETNYTNLEDRKYNAIMEHSIEDDEDDERFAIKRAQKITTEEQEKVFYLKRLDTHDIATTTSLTPEPSTYSYASPEIITSESTTSTPNSRETGNGIKFDTFNADVEEDTSTEKLTTESDLTTFTATLETTVDTTKTKEKPKLIQSNKHEDVSVSKSRLDWLDESYEEEIKSEKNMSGSPTTPEKRPLITINKVTTKAPKISNDVSGFSKEILEENLVKKSSTEEVMYKKEMDLLNSLDYGTEKSNTEASESKESEPNDKYSGDAFSSDFT